MDPMFSFPVEDNGSLFQVGDGYDIPVADDLRFFSSENVVHEQVLLDVVDWGCISNFSLLDEVEAFIPNGNLLVGNMDGGENHGRDCWSTGGEDQVNMIKARRDRSKAIASERKRRSRMKEKLYELRSLVPNITKMDKASIIADAIVYLQNLQRQEDILVEEITVLESFSHEEASNHVALQRKEKRNGHRGEILGLIAHEVGEKRFLLKIEFCNRGDGASSSLCNAIETLECFKLESSIITCTSSRYICTLTFNCREMREEMNALALKYRVMDALLKKGFPFMTTAIY